MKYFISQSWEIFESSKMMIPVKIILYKTNRIELDKPSTIKIGVSVSRAKCSRGWWWEFLNTWLTSGWSGIFIVLSVSFSWIWQAFVKITLNIFKRHLFLETENVSMHLVHVESLENFPIDEVSLVVSDVMWAVLFVVIFVKVYHWAPWENLLQQGSKACLSRTSCSTKTIFMLRFS